MTKLSAQLTFFLWSMVIVYTVLYIFQIHCKLLTTIYKIFLVAQNSWMFVEGLYLFLVVVKALLTKTIEFKHCLLIGWGEFICVELGFSLKKYHMGMGDIQSEHSRLWRPRKRKLVLKKETLYYVEQGNCCNIVFILVSHYFNSIHRIIHKQVYNYSKVAMLILDCQVFLCL